MVTARDPGRLTDVVAGHGDRAPALALDVTDKDRVAEAVKKAESAFGLIDVLVNHAGYGYLVALEEGEDEEVRALFDTPSSPWRASRNRSPPRWPRWASR